MGERGVPAFVKASRLALPEVRRLARRVEPTARPAFPLS